MFSPSATVLLNTLRPLLVSVKPSRRPRRLNRAPCLQHDPLHQWRSAGWPTGPAERVPITTSTSRRAGRPYGHVFDAVLAVAVQRWQDLGARLLAGSIRSEWPLAQVDRMAYEVSTGPPGVSPVPSATAVVTQTTWSN